MYIHSNLYITVLHVSGQTVCYGHQKTSYNFQLCFIFRKVDRHIAGTLYITVTMPFSNGDCCRQALADLGEGPGGPRPPLICRPDWGSKGRNKFVGHRLPLYLSIWMTYPPGLSDGLDPPLAGLTVLGIRGFFNNSIPVHDKFHYISFLKPFYMDQLTKT